MSAPPAGAGDTGGTGDAAGAGDAGDAAGTGQYEGRGLIRASWAGTVVFTVAAVAAVVREGAEATFAVVSLALFGMGLAAFLWSFARAVVRSQDEEIAVASLWFLAGSAPPSVRRSLLASVVVEVVVSLAAASLRPFTALAFGILVPVYGLGLCGVWAGRHGRFPVRQRPG